jgi:hypothetical protein
MLSRKNLIIGSLATLGAMTGTAPIPAGTITGPSSSASPYVINVPKNVDITAILTVGDSVNDKPDSVTPYRMVGIPDGLGAFDNYDGIFTVLMNHELPPADGIPRQHGFAGAFVSHWIGINESARFELQDLGDVREMTGAQIKFESSKKLVTEFLRPEDGAWDTRNPNVFYFVTTDRYDSTKDGSGTQSSQVARSRLHRLTFGSFDSRDDDEFDERFNWAKRGYR